jgi:cellobiose phosphorylase
MRHLVRDTGSHGLCDQHFADWNDGLEPSEKTGARESVMVTQQLCLGLLEVAELARRRGESCVESECLGWHAHFTALLNDVAWDGCWYVRTLCADGYRLGSDVNAEGKIFLNTQSWAVLSGTATDDRARACMEAVDRLIESDYGFAIAEPPFTAFDERVGKFSASRPYYAENGGCYNHAAGFKLVADCMLGRAEEAWRTFLKVAPGSPWNPVSNSCAEPFAFTNCYSRTPDWPGISMYPWRTGTAAWMTMGVVEWILGARRHYDGLLIDPCLPSAIPQAKVTRTFRDTVYHIILERTGTRSLSLDGTAISGNLLPPPDRGIHTVLATL